MHEVAGYYDPNIDHGDWGEVNPMDLEKGSEEWVRFIVSTFNMSRIAGRGPSRVGTLALGGSKDYRHYFRQFIAMAKELGILDGNFNSETADWGSGIVQKVGRECGDRIGSDSFKALVGEVEGGERFLEYWGSFCWLWGIGQETLQPEIDTRLGTEQEVGRWW